MHDRAHEPYAAPPRPAARRSARRTPKRPRLLAAAASLLLAATAVAGAGPRAVGAPQASPTAGAGAGQQQGPAPDRDGHRIALQLQGPAGAPLVRRSTPGPRSIRLKVVDARGGPVQDFHVQVLTVVTHPHLPQGRGREAVHYGLVDGLRSLPRRPRDFERGYTEVPGFWSGPYAVAVTAPMHARTLSTIFTVDAGDGDDQEVVVVLQRGGAIRGVVRDDAGAPVAGAEVSTCAPARVPKLRDEAQQIAPEDLEPFRADALTLRTTRTRADGSFVLDSLAGGDYCLRVRHADFCSRQLADVRVRPGETLRKTLALEPGAALSGVVRAGGAPRADVLVQVSTVPARGALPRTWRLRTDEQGRYRTAERLPAGTYKVAAFADGFDARNQLERFLRLQRVERLVTVPPERRAVEQDLELR